MRYKINEVESISFYIIPKELFTNPLYKDLSNDARLLYSVLRDRMKLSEQNNWTNAIGEIYLFFSRETAAELLSTSRPTITRAFLQLVKHNLIDEIKRGQGKPNIIYVNHIELQSLDMSQKEKIFTSRSKEFLHQDTKNLSPNDTDVNDTDLMMIDIKEFQLFYKEKEKEFEELETQEKERVSNAVKDIFINGIKDTKIQEVRETLKNLNNIAIKEGLTNYEKALTNISIANPEAYFKITLYNAIKHQELRNKTKTSVTATATMIHNLGTFEQREYTEKDIEDLIITPGNFTKHFPDKVI